jgi:hypothetical protein
MSERFTDLVQYDLRWPATDLALVEGAVRWLLIAAAIVAIAWLTFRAYRRFLQPR